MPKAAMVMVRVGDNHLVWNELGDCPWLWLRLGLRHLLVCVLAIIHIWSVYQQVCRVFPSVLPREHAIATRKTNAGRERGGRALLQRLFRHTALCPCVSCQGQQGGSARQAVAASVAEHCTVLGMKSVGLRKLLRVHRHGHLEHVVDLLFSFTPVTFPLLFHVAHGYFELTKDLQWVKGSTPPPLLRPLLTLGSVPGTGASWAPGA